VIDPFIEDRRDLAAVFRGAAMFSSQAGVCRHFSLKVRDDPLLFLLNRLGHILFRGPRQCPDAG
jgi:hypothetical protein